jgi:hypothetical protein
MKIRQARKIFRRGMFGRKANGYFSRIKLQTYMKALNRGFTLAISLNRKRRKEVGE